MSRISSGSECPRTSLDVMVGEATATPVMALDLIARIREVTDKQIKDVLLTHCHAVRVLSANAYLTEGDTEVIASQGTLELSIERGKEEMRFAMERFPRLFRISESVPGLTWPTQVIGGGDPVRGKVPSKVLLDLGGLKVETWSPGHGHTRGDTMAWVEEEKVLFSGDLGGARGRRIYRRRAVEKCGRPTLEVLRALNAIAIVPDRGKAMRRAVGVNKALDYTKRWVEARPEVTQP